MVELSNKRVRRFSAKGYFFIFVFIVLIFLGVFYSGVLKKNCGQDSECFNERLQECKSSKFINVRENNLYEYEIKGDRGNKCELEIELKQMGIGTPIKLIEKFEGKSMTCLVPQSVIGDSDIEEIGNIINFCSGPLKEAIFELIIDRMYGLIIQNMGEIANEVRTDLFSIG